ncbi:hypothetical protein A3709_20470 [Halioglobus sp. HI00S01]|uniref:DUF6804 family protein n=1 Tax=Halioglobus sp. HI00S01 TaxID=1822214 RepID=UPI0007C23B6E|nr:DUF6804 family protein [Halioglobus sp. HI00S01]KZX57988.1 hypothetical protein A3709_20470 [Halioglobus sp. HI00S01]
MNEKSILVVSIVLLALALLPLPYSYYMFLRIIVSASFTYICWKRITQQHSGIAWIFGFCAAIYNPFVPLHLGRELWTIINLATIGLAGYTLATKPAVTVEDNHGASE